MAQGQNQTTADQMTDDQKAFFRAMGREGGLTTAKRGPEYYREIGRKGRAKQLSGQTAEPKQPKAASSTKRPNRLRHLAEVVQTDDDPLSSVM